MGRILKKASGSVAKKIDECFDEEKGRGTISGGEVSTACRGTIFLSEGFQRIKASTGATDGGVRLATSWKGKEI